MLPHASESQRGAFCLLLLRVAEIYTANMSKKRAEAFPKPPTHDEFMADLGISDVVSRVIRVHLGIESVVTLALAESLPIPYSIELTRISFGLKTEILAALGVAVDLKAPLLKLNAIRNRFAHSREAKIDVQLASELLGALCDRDDGLLEKISVNY
jgi:hypothetical protein